LQSSPFNQGFIVLTKELPEIVIVKIVGSQIRNQMVLIKSASAALNNMVSYLKEQSVTILQINDTDYISLTVIAKFKSNDPTDVIANGMRNRNTNEYLGVWGT
jgi:hypothetical protein